MGAAAEGPQREVCSPPGPWDGEPSTSLEVGLKDEMGWAQSIFCFCFSRTPSPDTHSGTSRWGPAFLGWHRTSKRLGTFSQSPSWCSCGPGEATRHNRPCSLELASQWGCKWATLSLYVCIRDTPIPGHTHACTHPHMQACTQNAPIPIRARTPVCTHIQAYACTHVCTHNVKTQTGERKFWEAKEGRCYSVNMKLSTPCGTPQDDSGEGSGPNSTAN